MNPSGEDIAAFLIVVSFAAGLNVYATILTLGLLARADALALPGSLGLLAQWQVIAASAVLFAMEFAADKIPVFDLLWNAAQTLVRIPVGALLAFGASQPLGPGWQLIATMVGGAIALAAHGAKTAARATVTPSPEPFSNLALSLAEDGFAFFITWFSTRHPMWAAAIVIALLAAVALLMKWIIRALRRSWRALAPA